MSKTYCYIFITLITCCFFAQSPGVASLIDSPDSLLRSMREHQMRHRSKPLIELYKRNEFISSYYKSLAKSVLDSGASWMTISDEEVDERVKYFNKPGFGLLHMKELKNTVIKASLTQKIAAVQRTARPFELGSIPESFSPSDIDSDVNRICTTVRDQENCGSCWAFASMLSVNCRSAYRVYKNKFEDKRFFEGSIQQLHTCTYPGSKQYCQGGSPSDAIAYMEENPIVEESCQPYDLMKKNPNDMPEYVRCSGKCVDGQSFDQVMRLEIRGGGFIYPWEVSEVDIQMEIMKNGALIAAMVVYEDFMTYKSGVYSHEKGDYLGNHAVTIIGWGVENGINYWTCVNSWGTKFGENGLFKIKRGEGECLIDYMMWKVIAGEVLPPA